MNHGQWTKADQQRHDADAEACEQAEAHEEAKQQEGRIEGLEGDVEKHLARIHDLEAAIENTLHMAVRIFAATGHKDITRFCTAHLAGVLGDGKKQADIGKGKE